MKLVIPAECEIGANKVRIRSNEQAMRIADCRGQMSQPESIIRLSLSYEGFERSNQQLFESLIHEIVHWVDHLYIRGLEESQVGSLACGIAQALLSMGIEPDFSQVPEE